MEELLPGRPSVIHPGTPVELPTGNPLRILLIIPSRKPIGNPPGILLGISAGISLESLKSILSDILVSIFSGITFEIP